MTGTYLTNPIGELAQYRAAAITATRLAIKELERHGVEALVTGSLVDDSFSLQSDVDILIVKCPRRMKYALEGIVEDALDPIPFDVVYVEEIPTRKLHSFVDKARRVQDLD
ncbi:MAG: nucleotidyltransferase domain-containing protein [Janthinobacterium lividum]